MPIFSFVRVYPDGNIFKKLTIEDKYVNKRVRVSKTKKKSFQNNVLRYKNVTTTKFLEKSRPQICSANQLSGFYMIGTSVIKQLSAQRPSINRKVP